MGEHMIKAPVPPPQPIAAVLADVDGTLVTSAKVVTTRAIEAIEKLHQRGVLFAITSGRPPRGMRMLIHPTGDARADGRLQRRDHRAAGHDHR
jgi:beta-phosphoglucomutase-like phosphatase (HAD superfamily)